MALFRNQRLPSAGSYELPGCRRDCSPYRTIHDRKHAKALDETTARYERDIICYGSPNRSRAWKMRRENLSSRYTTCLDEILTAN
ncbi:DUF4113 domain-containing protein [Bradyrhizobium sp. DASA03007]|uniref:DUF4113 domain-containing protein n=1 Tax=unclassified Bradyrhizobium TaxID=2631580 RepID=UPI003F724D47